MISSFPNFNNKLSIYREMKDIECIYAIVKQSIHHVAYTYAECVTNTNTLHVLIYMKRHTRITRSIQTEIQLYRSKNIGRR